MNRRLPAASLLVLLLVAGCSSAAAPPPSRSPIDEPGSPPPESPVALHPTRGPDRTDSPDDGEPGNASKPRLVLPKPGQKNPRPVSIEKLSARASGRHVVVNAQWWSGIEPCTVLDSVGSTLDGSTITVSVREGTGRGEVACIDIAVLKVTVIDLGELEPGTYTIVPDQGTAEAVTVTVR